jgi:hypothetical protein
LGTGIFGSKDSKAVQWPVYVGPRPGVSAKELVYCLGKQFGDNGRSLARDKRTIWLSWRSLL